MPKLKPGTIIPTPEEDVAITAAAKSDPDTIYFETDEEYAAFFANAMSYKTYMARRTKVAISIRLDQEIIDHFKAGGPGWQGRINDTLKAVVHGDFVSVHEQDTPAFKHDDAKP